MAGAQAQAVEAGEAAVGDQARVRAGLSRLGSASGRNCAVTPWGRFCSASVAGPKSLRLPGPADGNASLTVASTASGTDRA